MPTHEPYPLTNDVLPNALARSPRLTALSSDSAGIHRRRGIRFGCDGRRAGALGEQGWPARLSRQLEALECHLRGAACERLERARHLAEDLEEDPPGVFREQCTALTVSVVLSLRPVEPPLVPEYKVSACALFKTYEYD